MKGFPKPEISSASNLALRPVKEPMALDMVNLMRDDGVLISTTGANEDTLKVRPPLICQAEHGDGR